MRLLRPVPLYAHAGPVAAKPILAPPAPESLKAAFQACNQRFDGRLSYAFLPSTARSAGFDRLEAVTLTSADLAGDARERRWINTLNAVYAPDEGPQFSVQFGGRLIERNGAIGGSSYTDLLSLEIQHEFATGWNVASHIGARHSWMPTLSITVPALQSVCGCCTTYGSRATTRLGSTIRTSPAPRIAPRAFS